MFSHTTLGTNDLELATAFYDAVMGVLGHNRFYSDDECIIYGDGDGDQFCLVCPFDKSQATVGNGTMIALVAANREAVRTAHKVALENGGSDEGAPGLRSYHENYYGTYIRDPDGNKLCVVCHKKE